MTETIGILENNNDVILQGLIIDTNQHAMLNDKMQYFIGKKLTNKSDQINYVVKLGERNCPIKFENEQR